MKITGKIWEFLGFCQPSRRCDITNSYTVGPLLPVSRAFPCVLVCLYHQRETARKTALVASWRLYMKKPGFDPRFSVFLAALEALHGLF